MTLTESRAVLTQALELAGIRVLPPGQAAPPSAFITQGSPWSVPAQLGAGRRAVRWVIVGVVSVASDAGTGEAEALADLVAEAVRGLPAGWGLASIETPGILSLAGGPYLAFRAELQTVI